MLKNLKKIGCTFLAAAMMMTAMAGCSGNGGSAEQASGSAKSSGETSSAGTQAKLSGSITVAGWNDAADALSEEAKAFMKENPGTMVTVQKVDSNYTKLYSQLAANTDVPDVVQMQNRDLLALKTNIRTRGWI